jgi:hypothetical protein
MNEPKKLKAKDVKTVRKALLEKQGFFCAICKLPCTEEQAVLDHDHTHGHVRAVLHRGCNAAEGKVMNTLRRYGIKAPEEFLRGLLAYHDLHSTNQSGYIHPAHRTEDEKKELAKKRARRRRTAIKLKSKE